MLLKFLPANPLRLADARILAEQLRLSMGNVGNSVIPVFLVAILMSWVLANDSNALTLRIWAATVILTNLNGYRYARRHAAGDIAHPQARRVAWALIGLNALDGVLWGALAWLTLDTAGTAGSILVAAVIAGMAGGAVSMLSPVLPVFVAFAVPLMALMALKISALNDPAYFVLAAACALYAIALFGQARNSSLATRAAIELRFENIALMERLGVETLHAKTEHHKAELAQQEAEQANAAKSKFLAAASHDLRQPIHAQGLFLDVLSHTELTGHQRTLLANVCAASDASAEMLNTLLDFSRIESGVIKPRLQAFRLQPLLNKIEREFAQQADAKGLTYHSRETPLMVHSDPALVELILRNLAANAIRYTQRGGLLVACRRRGDQAVLEVWDTGIGISAANQREVFREFHQLGNPERDRHKGLGLGLAIVEGLARTLGHELSLVSTPQRGSVFRLSLPLGSTMTDMVPAAERRHTARQNPAEMQALAARVLVIDDDEAVRSGMLYLLQTWGCACEAAESIEDALALARIRTPDAIISDYRLRDQQTGLEAIAALRQLFGDALPALLITGDTAPDRLRQAEASGIPLLHKPVVPGDLYRGLLAVLQAR